MERITWGILVPSASIVLILAIVAAGQVVPAGTNSVDPQQVMPGVAQDCQPEPLEQTRYLLAIAVAPLVFWFGAIVTPLLKRHLDEAWSMGAAFCVWAWLVQALFCAFIVWMVMVRWNEIGGYFRPSALPWVVAAISCCALAYRWHSPAHRLRGKQQPPDLQWSCLSRLGPFTIASLFTTIGLLPSFFRTNQPNIEYYFEHHLSFQINEFAAVLNGRTPRVDFFPQYQCILSFLFAPWFRLWGMGVGTFSSAMVLASALGFLAMFAIFVRVTGNGWKALGLYLPFLWVTVQPIRENPAALSQHVSAFNYFAIGPLRYLGPWLTAAMVCCYWSDPSRIRLFFVGFVGALSAVNNLDFGIPACAGAMLSVTLITEHGDWPCWRSLVHTTLTAAAGASSALVLCIVFCLLRSGRVPDLAALLQFQRGYATYGYFMLPMPPFGLHWIAYVTFMAAIAAACLSRTSPNLLRAMLLFSGVFGAGALAYYVGRSHWECLFMVSSAWALAFLLLAWHWWTADPARSVAGLLIAPQSWLIVMGYVVCVSTVAKTPNIGRQITRLTAPAGKLWPRVEPFAQFIREHTIRGEKIGLIYPYGFLIALKANVENVFPFSQHESLILRDQMHLALREFERKGVKRVFGGVSDALAVELQRLGFARRGRLESMEWWERPSADR